MISLGAQPARAVAMQMEMAGVPVSADALAGYDPCADKSMGARPMASCHLVCSPATALLPAAHGEIAGIAARYEEPSNLVSAGREERPRPHPPKSARHD